MDFSFLSSGNLLFLEELYQKYMQNPGSIDKPWREVFSTIDIETPHEVETKSLHKQGRYSLGNGEEAIKINKLIYEYRANGHFIADLNPLNRRLQEIKHDIKDLGQTFLLNGQMKLKEASKIIEILREAYCSTIGLEFMHIRHAEEKEWFQEKLENSNWRASLDKERKRKIFQDIMEAEMFENYLHVKFPGAKRFSIEGAESAIAGLETIIEESSNFGAQEVLIGMPHRGRLNVLTKVLRKKYAAMLYEFQGNVSIPQEYEGSGDVKYHMGYSSNRMLRNGKKVHLSLAANPSHLEAVNSVLMGKVRAKQGLLKSTEKALGVLIHGDAAFTGQGVVHECFNLNSVGNYSTGGLVHIIINNQVGFTTNPCDARGYHYPAYAAVAYEIPIFHLNGDDPEAVVFASMVATEYRYKFKKDVIVGVQCYRKYGHNEGDEPMFTQPKMYSNIAKHKSPMNIYAEQLISEKVLTQDEITKMQTGFRGKLDKELAEAKNYSPDPKRYYTGLWQEFPKQKIGTKFVVVPGVPEEDLKILAQKITTIPNNIKANKKVERLLSSRLEAIQKGVGIDWGNAEHLAFASLLEQGINIRLAGQDSKRGTFSHRHSVILDQENEKKFVPLNNFPGSFEVIDSTLSEYAAMGFEYGYSLINPNDLVLWEAQFGDFVNGAQIIIDQFISSAETKWLESSGFVLLLPHGYEGQGPEHSSARIERFLQLCAEDNMQVVNCSTPASYFHVLRRQVYNNFRKPLIIFTPKSLLRHKQATSSLQDLSKKNSFKAVIPDVRDNQKDVKRLVFCTGKVYYNIVEAAEDREDIAVVRIEQLYPFPAEEIQKKISKYNPQEIVWCQEEPKNMGPWFFIQQFFSEILNQSIRYAGRISSASPASGYLKIHNEEQKKVTNEIIN